MERGFFTMLLPRYAHKGTAQADTLLDRLVTGLAEGRPDNFMRELQALFANIPYERGKPVEAYFRNLLFIVFRLVGFYCEMEHPQAGGRSDMVIRTDNFIYLPKLKVDQSAEAAQEQIEVKGYAAPNATDPRKLFKLGRNFSTRSMRIDEWRVVEARSSAISPSQAATMYSAHCFLAETRVGSMHIPLGGEAPPCGS